MPTGEAPARAALAGNPSDGYGGRVVAFCVDAMRARVELEPFDGVELVGPDGEVRRFASGEEAVETPVAEPVDGAALLHAAVRRRMEVPASFALRASTSIPREVGLGSSSALVIAALRALGAHSLDADALALLAWEAETAECGIHAGMQDRVVQARGGLVSMDFAEGGRHTDLDPSALPSLYVAWNADASEASTVVHAELRARHEAGEAELREGMGLIAQTAADAHDAIVAGDRKGLHAAIDRCFDLRRALMPVDSRNIAMAEAARSAGASANSAGSGGAIAGTLAPDTDADHLRAALAAAGATLLLIERP